MASDLNPPDPPPPPLTSSSSSVPSRKRRRVSENKEEADEKDEKNLLDLPPEVIQKILEFLSLDEIIRWLHPVGNVHLRSHCEDARDARLRKSLQIYHNWNSAKASDRIRKAGHNLKTLGISYRLDDSNVFLVQALKECSNLREVKVYLSQDVSAEVLRAVGSHGSSLRRLTLDRTDVTSQVLTEEASNLSRLTHLEMRDLKDVKFQKDLSKEALRAVADHCARLECLDMRRFETADEESLAHLLDKVGGTLKHLLKVTRLSDASCARIRSRCPLLETLDVSTGNLHRDGLAALFELPNLQTLSLSSCFRRPTAGGQFDFLQWAGSRDFVLALTGRRLEKLTSLKLVGGFFLDDAALEIVVSSCPCLASLHLRGYMKLTNVGVRGVLLRGCPPQLRSLVLRGAEEVTLEGIKDVVPSSLEVTLT